jgi:NAD+ kinase
MATTTGLKRFLVYGNPSIPAVKPILDDLVKWTRSENLSMTAPGDLFQLIDPSCKSGISDLIRLDPASDQVVQLSGSDPATLFADDDLSLMVCLGGDGTMLHGIRKFWPILAPVAGISLGMLSFNSVIKPENLIKFMETWLEGTIHVSERLVLKVRRLRNDKVIDENIAINDVVLKQAGTRLIYLTLKHGQQLISRYSADGLIVSTPTGSTAYNLSAGGPILYPEMHALLATAICPHTLACRPVLLPPDPPVTLEFDPHHGRRDAQLIIDGQECWPISEEDRISLSAETRPLRLIVDPEVPYFTRLRQKLSWSGEIPHE